MKKVVIVPTYNEAMNILPLIERISTLLPDASIAVVDDNSPDGTAQVVRTAQRSHPNVILLSRQQKEGLGKAYLYAFENILADKTVGAIAMMDADFSHNPDYLPDMFTLLSQADVVVGSRYVSGGKVTGWVFWRRFLSRWGNFYARIITGLPIRDLTGGFILIKADFLRMLDFSTFDASGYAFLMELKSHLYKKGAHLKEFPVIFKNRVGGESKLSGHIIREGVTAPWRIRFKKI